MDASATGFVCIPLAQLRNIRLLHLISGLDEYGEIHPGDAAVLTAITGYTEWIGDGSITIGWDWKLHATDRHIELRRVSEPASNLVLLNADGDQMSESCASALLENYVDDLNWHPTAWEHIVSRYES